MSQKTVCDVCEVVIKDGENAGLRQVAFNFTDYRPLPMGESFIIEVTTKVRVNGKSDPDLCVPCLKRAVQEA